MVSWTTMGNVAHAASFVTFMSFAICVALENKSSLVVSFDASWKQWGFCVTNPNVPYWTSHDLCLYADLILGGLLGITYLRLHNTPGMEQANELVGVAVLGTIGHGIGHGAIAAGMRNGTDETMLQEEEGQQQLGYQGGLEYDNPIELVLKLVPLVFFWVALLKQVVPKATWLSVVAMSLVSMVLSLVIPKKFGFTYVQSVLNVASTINETLRSRDQKDRFEYTMYPIMVSIPLGMVGWIESTMCTKGGVIHIGGHLIYDAYIPLSLLAYYILCYRRQSQAVVSPQKKVN